MCNKDLKRIRVYKMSDSNLRKRRYTFGHTGEAVARLFLAIKGYRLVAHNYKTYFGEIDIIARDRSRIIFIEVKTRMDISDIEMILRKKQVARIKRAAEFFLSRYRKYEVLDTRFDLILINRFLVPTHLKNYLV